MDFTSYWERWAWVSLTLLVFALLSPSAVLLGLGLWLWLHWKPEARLRWVVAGLLLLASWAGLVLLWDTLADQLVALREAITGYTGVGTLLTRALPVWGVGTLLFPTIAGIVQWFRPQPLIRPARVSPAAPAARPAEPAAATPLNDVAARLTVPTPAVRPDVLPQDTPTPLAS